MTLRLQAVAIVRGARLDEGALTQNRPVGRSPSGDGEGNAAHVTGRRYQTSLDGLATVKHQGISDSGK